MANPNIPIDRRTNRVELIGLVLGVLLAIWVYKIFPANAGDIALAAAKGKKLHVEAMPVVAAAAARTAAVWAKGGIWTPSVFTPIIMTTVIYKNTTSPQQQGRAPNPQP